MLVKIADEKLVPLKGTGRLALRLTMEIWQNEETRVIAVPGVRVQFGHINAPACRRSGRWYPLFIFEELLYRTLRALIVETSALYAKGLAERSLDPLLPVEDHFASRGKAPTIVDED